MTTPDGYFVFRNLPAGLFTAATRAFGYLEHDYPPTLIEVRDGQKPTEVRLRVWKHAAIGGRVVDERAEPIAGIVVSALQRVTSGGTLVLRRAATGVTDDRGEYRLAQLAPGDYMVGVLSMPTSLPEGVAAALDPSVDNREALQQMRSTLIQSGFFRTYGCETCTSNSHEGHHVDGFVLQRPGPSLPPAPDGRPLGYANTFHPGTTLQQDATVIALGSGQSRADLDFAVRLTPTVIVAGVLTGPDGPMPHAALNLVPPGASMNEFEPAVGTAITDGRGAFAFLAITPGEYTLRSSVLLDANDTTGEGRPLWTSQSLNVGEDGVAGLDVMLQPGVPMSGRVDFRGLTDAADRPPERQVIGLQPVGAQLWRTLRSVVQPDGTFRSAGDPPGRYIINASSPPGWFLQTMTVDGKPMLDDMIELVSSEVSGLVLTFGQTTNRVSGRVTADDGAADPDAAVIVFPADSSAWSEGIFTTRRVRKVHATSAGVYEMATLAPGEYYVAAISREAALNWQDPALLDRLIAGATRVTLGPDNERTVPLRTLPLRGR
jgi:hypothetical protein